MPLPRLQTAPACGMLRNTNSMGGNDTHMDDKTNLTPEQDEVQTGEEVSFTISGEDAAAQEALNAKKTAKKKSPLPWIIGGAAVVVAAALVLILTLKPKTVSPDAEQPGDATISEPADTPNGTDNT